MWRDELPSFGAKPLDWRVGLALSVLIVGVFGLGDLLILIGSPDSHLLGVSEATVSQFEETVIYLPFARAFRLAVPLPASPTVEPSISGITVYPALTLVLQGILYRFVCFGSLDAYLLLMRMGLPLVSFWLIYLVFSRYISKCWSITLAFLGITYHSQFSFAGYCLDLIREPSRIVEFASGGLPEITRLPFPSLSFPLFCLTFYMTFRWRSPSMKRTIILSCCWALHLYVYLFNFLAGVLFFLAWRILGCWRAHSTTWLRQAICHVTVVLAISVAISIPYAATLSSPTGQMLVDKSFADPQESSLVISQWGLALGYLLPLGLLMASLFLFRGDSHELWVRFSPVILAVAVDFFLGSLHIVFPGRFSAELYYHRISNLLFRFFYFIPFLYFCSIPKDRGPCRNPGFFHRVFSKMRSVLRTVFFDWQRVICAGFLVSVGIILVLGAVHRFDHHREKRIVAMAPTLARIAMAKDVNSPGLVAYDTIGANLMAPVLTGRGTLLPSVFGNFSSDSIILERLVLFAKIFKWEEERLLNFFDRDGEFLLWKNSAGGQVPLVCDSLEPGLGYWLMNHNQRMEGQSYEVFLERVRKAFRTLSLDTLIARHSLVAVVADSRQPLAVPVMPSETNDGLTLYWLDREDLFAE